MKRRLFAGALLLLALAFTALGVWQLERRAWKLKLIAEVDAGIHGPPTPLSAWSQVRGGDAYRRVRIRGLYLDDRETLVQAVTDLGPGWWVMTPLQSEAGVVLVNRGFVPPERKDPATRPTTSSATPATVTGLVRMSEPHGGFLRANDPASNRWFSRDVAAITRARGLASAAPFFIDADASPNPGGYPIGGLTVVAFSNTHLVYALTWFALAGLSLFGASLVLRSKQQA